MGAETTDKQQRDNRETTERQQRNNRKTTEPRLPLLEARQEGVEPPTHSLEGCCSIHLSYWRFTASCSLLQHLTPARAGNRGGRIRTGDLLLPKQARYRATLRPAEETKNIRTTPEDQLPSSTFRNSASTARPRWLTRAFSSRVTIPNGAPRPL